MASEASKTAAAVTAMARSMEPFIRRAIIGGRTMLRLAGNLGGDVVDLAGWDLEPASDPGQLTAEAEAVIITDMDSMEPSSWYRMEVAGDANATPDKPERAAQSLMLKPPRAKREAPSQDEALWPRGTDSRDAQLRMALRHAETATHRALTAQDSAVRNLQLSNDSLHRTIETMRATMNADAAAAGEHLRATKDADARLLEAEAKREGILEAGRALRYLVPRIADQVSGADKMAPLLRLVARLKPENIQTMVSVGMISADEGADLAEFCTDLMDEKRDRRELRKDRPSTGVGRTLPANVRPLVKREGDTK